MWIKGSVIYRLKKASVAAFMGWASVAVVGMFGSESAWARCVMDIVSPGDSDVVIPRDAPVGYVIYRFPYSFSIQCNPTDAGARPDWQYRIWTNNPDNGASAISGVRNTEVPGIGFRITSANVTTNAKVVHTERRLDGAPVPDIFLPLTSNTAFNGLIELIKTGNISDDYTRAQLFEMDVSGDANWNAHVNSKPIANVACRVDTKNLQIPMGEVVRTTFNGTGSVSAPQTRNIQLTCDAQTPVKIKLEGAPDSSGLVGVLALTNPDSEDTAKNVGLQMSINNVPVTFGVDREMGVAPGGTFNVPLTVRYQQTNADKVRAGQANGTATFTMTYN